jgi:hypothetical protein
LRAVYVEYISRQRPGTQPLRRPDIIDGRWRTTYAIKGEARFARIRGTHFHPDAAEPQSEPERVTFFDGEVCGRYTPADRSGTIFRSKQGSLDLDTYLTALFIPATDELRALLPDVGPFYLPYALFPARTEDEETLPSWSVRPYLEAVDGVLCHVLESKQCIIWIDHSGGFGVRFRQIRFSVPDEHESEWPMWEEEKLSEYREVAGGVVLPHKIQLVIFYSPNYPKNFWNKIKAVKRIMVISARANEAVEDELFRFRFPPGTKVTDMRTGKVYQVARTEGSLREVADLAASIRESRHSRQGAISWSVVLVLTAVAVIIGAGAVWHRRRKGA